MTTDDQKRDALGYLTLLLDGDDDNRLELLKVTDHLAVADALAGIILGTIKRSGRDPHQLLIEWRLSIEQRARESR